MTALLIAETKTDQQIVPSGLDGGDWVQAGILIVVAVVLAVGVSRVVIRLVAAGNRSRIGVAHLLGRLAGLFVFAGGVVYALNTLGVRIGPLLGALGIVGIALAFALQDILENLVAGVILQARNPFRYGDQLESGDWTGTVEDINFRAVVLRTFEGTRVVLPSSTVLKASIHNLTAFEHRRTTVEVGVAYGTDLRRAAEVIGEAVRDAEGVEAEPEPEVLLEELGESSVNFAVRFWHEPKVATMWRARDRVLLGVYEALGDAGIEIPFPHRTLAFVPGAEPPAEDRAGAGRPDT